MQYLDNDNEFNIADLSEFIQDTYILDNEIGFDNIGLDDLLDREHNDELILPSEEEGSQKTQSLENIYCFPTEDVSLSRTDSKDEVFLTMLLSSLNVMSILVSLYLLEQLYKNFQTLKIPVVIIQKSTSANKISYLKITRIWS